MPDVRAKGKLQPIISQELFDQVQDFLDGKKPITMPKRRTNPAFPLRGLFRCGACGGPLTASFCRSKTGKRYAHYYCFKKGCLSVKSTRAEALDDQFMSMIGALQPRAEIAAEFSTVAAQVWDAQQGESYSEVHGAP